MNYSDFCKLHNCKISEHMKYPSELIIDLPREEVIKKLDNPENMKYWQKGISVTDK